MRKELKDRLEKLTTQEREERFQELLKKHGIIDPKMLTDKNPDPIHLEELEEREWLKKSLGYP